VKVVEVDNAVRWDTILSGREIEFGDQPTSGSCNCGNDHCADPICNRVSGQHQNGTVTAGGCGEPNLTPLH
jgi:hypothetical protein